MPGIAPQVQGVGFTGAALLGQGACQVPLLSLWWGGMGWSLYSLRGWDRLGAPLPKRQVRCPVSHYGWAACIFPVEEVGLALLALLAVLMPKRDKATSPFANMAWQAHTLLMESASLSSKA